MKLIVVSFFSSFLDDLNPSQDKNCIVMIRGLTLCFLPYQHYIKFLKFQLIFFYIKLMNELSDNIR